MTTRTRSLARSMAINLTGNIFPLVVAVVAIPVTVRTLGSDRFGLLAFAWVIFAYSTMFDLGVSRAVTRYAAEAIAAQNNQGLSQLAWNALVANSILGFLGAVLFLIASPYLTTALNVPSHLAASAQQSMYIVSGAIPVTLVMTTFRALLEADHRFDLVNLVTAPTSALLYLLPALAAVAGFDVPLILVMILLSRIASMAAFAYLSRRVLPQSLRMRVIDRDTLGKLFAYGGWVTVSGIAGTTFAYADRILVSFFRGVGAVTYYAVPYEIVARIWLIPTAISAVLFPAFSALNTSPRELRRLYGKALVVLLSSMGAVVVGLMLSGGELLTLWVGADIAKLGAPVMRVLVVGVGINSLAFVPFTLLQGAGRPDLTGKVHGVSLAPFLVVGVALAEALGPIGVALAFTLRLTTEAALLFLSAARIAPAVSSVMITTPVLITSFTVALALFAAVLLVALDAPLVLRSGFVLLTTAVMLAGVWRLGLEPSQREAVVRSLREASRR